MTEAFRRPALRPAMRRCSRKVLNRRSHPSLQRKVSSVYVARRARGYWRCALRAPALEAGVSLCRRLGAGLLGRGGSTKGAAVGVELVAIAAARRRYGGWWWCDPRPRRWPATDHLWRQYLVRQLRTARQWAGDCRNHDRTYAGWSHGRHRRRCCILSAGPLAGLDAAGGCRMGPINEHLVCAEVEATAVTRCVRMLGSAGLRRRRCGSELRPE